MDDASPTDEPSNDEVRSAIGSLLPDASVLDATPVDRGKNAVYRATVDRDASDRDPGEPERVVLKVGTRTDGTGFLAEPRFLDVVGRRTAIPVPAVLAVDAGDLLGRPCFVMESLSGTTVKRRDELPPETTERICFEAGRHLGELHARVPAEGFGTLRPGSDPNGGLRMDREFDGWPDLFETAVTANVERLVGTGFEDLVPALRERARTLARDLDGGFEPVAMHHDYRLENLLLDEDAAAGRPTDGPATTAVLDWGTPTTGHAEYELAVTEAVLTNRPSVNRGRRGTLRRRLYEGYRRTNSLTRDSGFEERRRTYRFTTRIRLMVHLREEMAGATEAEADARAAEHRAFLDRYDLSG